MARCFAILVLLAGLLSMGGGCARTRVVTISTIPPDAIIRVDARERGRGPITETFNFSGGIESHRVQAEREGYRPRTVTITPDSGESLIIELKPTPRRVVFSVGPMPAIVKLDGRPLSASPVREVPADIEFHLDASGRWSTHKVKVEREGFQPDERTLRYEDTDLIYDLNLQAMRKDIHIATTPPDAHVFINDERVGSSPFERKDFAVPIDIDTGEYAPQKLTIKKTGYEDVQDEINWDSGKSNYGPYVLKPQSKIVRIIPEPKDATVTLDGVELKPDGVSGAMVTPSPLSFGPRDESGAATVYKGIIRYKKTLELEFEDKEIGIAWDGGKTDYKFRLKEILVRKVTLLRVVRDETGWSFIGKSVPTLGMKDVTEGSESNRPLQITKLKGAKIDTVTVSPDGSQVLFTTLSNESGQLRSQIFTQPSDGNAAPKPLSDGTSLDITPAYTPDGSQIVFASNRAGRKLNIWSRSATAAPMLEQLTTLDNDLWPSVDSNPKPRLYYQSYIETRPDARLFSATVGTNTRQDLTVAGGGTQPRVAPTADAVVFAAANPKTDKRDIFRMSDLGADVINLTNTPSTDEFDAVWSNDAQRIAYVSDQGRGADAPDNHDIWVIDAAGGSEPQRVTQNGSWDDSPAWDVRGQAIYFRSNRGGDWNIWRIELK